MSHSLPVLRSMTAYGRAEKSFDLGDLSFEVRILNKRFLDVQLHMPHELVRFEPLMRKQIATRVARGHVKAHLLWHKASSMALPIVCDRATALGMKRAYASLCEALEVPFDQTLVPPLLMQKESLFYMVEKLEDEMVFQKVLPTVIDHAFNAADLMREEEGKALCVDLMGHVEALARLFASIEEKSPGVVTRMKERLEEKLKLLQINEIEERVAKEVALFAERVDVQEEIARSKSHLKQMHFLLNNPLQSPTEAKGKRLEFLIQEMLRESNALSSKAQDVAVSHLVIDAKIHLEQMREQIQNVE